MKNALFDIKFDKDTGCITEIVNPSDQNKMNWCSDLIGWGKIKTLKNEVNLIEFKEDNETSIAFYQNDKLTVTVTRSFNPSGNFTEKFMVKNITDTVLCINRDNFAIALPFNDKYTFADDCMVNRCNTHIWCGQNSSWINALKMGDSDINLGLFLTKGSLISYSQYSCTSNIRGYFELEPATVFLNPNDDYSIEWELFWHKGKKDFFEKLSAYENYIEIRAEHFTFFEGETLGFEIFTYNNKVPTVYCQGKEIPVKKREKGGFLVELTAQKSGEYKFIIQSGDVITHAQFLIKIPFKNFVENRINYIIDHQQCLDKSSPLYGAYLIYDNKIQSPYFDFYDPDHNACRERMNMPLALIKYLQTHKNEKVARSIELYIQFLYREFFEETTGEVFNTIGKRRDMLRLYNAPGVMLILTEMYYYTGEEKYLDSILMLAKNYYHIGGEKCYSNAVAIKKTYNAFVKANRLDDAKIIKDFFNLHTQTMMKIGTSYPAHEVNYEQTIVTPAVNCISQFGTLCEDKSEYIRCASEHLECLERFMGNQPSFHLNEISIRFWDDRWFGKSRAFGDTLPQHLSCLSGRAFIAYGELTENDEYIKRAENCIRNCMCLISDNGIGSASYVYPNRVNDKNGEFYDEWANDQDLVIYDSLDMQLNYPKTFGA